MICPFHYQGQYEDAETGLYYNRFRYYSPDEGMYISQDPIGLAGNNPTLYGYVHDSNGWVDQLGLDCGKAKIYHYDGDANNRFGHYSIEITNKNGLSVHTHQVITSRDLSTTTITHAKNLPAPNKTVEIDIPNATEAIDYQLKVFEKELGAYSKEINSCVDHVSEVLRKGGINVPEGSISQLKYLKNLGF